MSPGDAFCQKCGARQIALGEPFPARHFCTSCGAPLAEGNAFCAKCGAFVSPPPVQASSPQASPPAPPARQPVPQAPVAAAPAAGPSTPAPPSQSGSLLLKIVLAVIGFFFLATVVAIGGCVYLGYRARQRIDKVQQAYKHDDVAGMVQAIKGDTSPPAQKLPQWKPAPAALVSAPGSKIPMKVSLRIVVAGNDPLQGDYESIFAVDSANDKEVHIKASLEYPKPTKLSTLLGQPTGNTELSQKIRCGRTLLRADLENSAEDPGYFCMGNQENKFPGTTGLGLSRNTFNELKTGGEPRFTTHEDPMKALFKSFKSTATGSTDPTELLNRLIPVPGSPPPPTPAIKCTLRRVGDGDVAVPIIVNNQQVELPAIHAVCQTSDNNDRREGYILDDPDNPLSLAGVSQSEGISQIIRISWDQDRPANPIEQQLQTDGRAKVYGIYFDFASDTLRAESKAVLDEIADVMRRHPDWKLRVEGHTDNIGGDTYNLDLSKRRAAAVKQALVSNYGIGADRLTTAGFGSSRPVAANDTLEGRALNRRVELVKE